MTTTPKLSQAFALARSIAAFGLHQDENHRVISVEDEIWPVLLNTLHDQRLTGLAVLGGEAEWLHLSSAQRDELLSRHRDAMLQALGLERTLVTLSAAFDDAGIEMVVLKGSALAHTVYPDPSWRPFADLDALVRGRDWRRACDVLASRGFRRGLPEPRPGFDIRFGKAAEYRGENGLTVDLHRTLVVGPFGLWMDPEELFEDTRPLSVGGRLLRRLDDSTLLLHQCMHASLGWWPPLLMPLRDVAQVAWAADVDWESLRERARRWRLAAVARLALHAASETLDVQLPDEARALMSIEPRRQELRALEAYTTDRRSRGGAALSALRAIPGMGAKLTYVRALLFPSREFLMARQGNACRSYLRRVVIPVRWLMRKGHGSIERQAFPRPRKEGHTISGQVSMGIKRFIPDPLKPPLRRVRRAARRMVASLSTPLRAHAYRSPRSRVHLLPAQLRRWWRLDPPPQGSRRIEVGSGALPRPGYVHVDIDPDSISVDLLVSGHSLPLPDAWSDEVLNVHMIEHVPPSVVRATLREWFRVLRDGGILRIHTPDGEALGRALIESATGAGKHFWPLQSAIFGYGFAPHQVTGPEALGDHGDHRMVFTFPVLRELLEEAGFSQVRDVSGEDPCHHYVNWGPYVSGLCLEIVAVKSEATRQG